MYATLASRDVVIFFFFFIKIFQLDIFGLDFTFEVLFDSSDKKILNMCL